MSQISDENAWSQFTCDLQAEQSLLALPDLSFVLFPCVSTSFPQPMVVLTPGGGGGQMRRRKRVGKMVPGLQSEAEQAPARMRGPGWAACCRLQRKLCLCTSIVPRTSSWGEGIIPLATPWGGSTAAPLQFSLVFSSLSRGPSPQFLFGKH